MSDSSVVTLPEGTVTVLSTDLVGSTALNQRLGDEAATAIEREVEGLALAAVGGQNGVVIKETGDGLMAAFQSARRAVACAREIQSALARRNRSQAERAVQLRVGLHTGEVIAENGELHGETVLIAKRIEENALPGTIFVSDTVYGVLGTARAELEDRGDFELKGIEIPWRLFELPWADAEASGVLPPHERTPYVGRAAQLSRLLAALERAQAGTGSLILVGGEAGVGKTRLLEEVGEQARRQGVRVLVGRSPDRAGAVPYLPWIEQIEQSAREVSPELLREALGESAPQIAKLMPELRGRYPDIPEPPALPPEQERRFLLAAFSEFVERSARGNPLLLVLEDLHWADESTLVLLEHLAQRLESVPVLLVGIYRHDRVEMGQPLAEALPRLLRARLSEELLLERLGEADVARMLEGRAGQAPPAELVTLVYSETEGNAFFVEEVFRHLQESDKLFEAEGGWRSGVQIADTEVPRSVGLVIGQRLERVSEACRRILTIAALSGKSFRYDLLARFEGVEEDPLLEALEEAAGANLVNDVSTGREARYQFAHEQIRQTLLSQLSFARRQRLHRQMADALEELHGGDAEVHAREIAHHLYEAGASAQRDRTAHWLEKASRRAIDALAFEDALRDLDAARSVLEQEKAAAAARILRLRARALRGLGRIEEAGVALDEAVATAPEGTERDEALHARAQLHLDLFRGKQALRDLGPLLARARETGDRPRELELSLAEARAHYVLSLDSSGYAETTREAYEQAYALAVELGDRRAMARALIPTCWLVDYFADYRDRALANNDEAVAIAAELADEELEIEAMGARLRLLTPSVSIAQAEELRDRLEARRDPVRLKEHYFWLMWQYWMLARFEDSVQACDAGIALARQLGSPPVQYPTIKALALIDLGRFDEARDSLAEEVADAAHPFGRAVQLMGEAFWLERVGALEPAVETARKVLTAAGELSRTWMQSLCIDLLAVLAARLGPAGEELREFVAASAEETGFQPSPLPSGELALARGDAETALAEARGMVESGGRIGMLRMQLLGRELELRALGQLGRWQEVLERADAVLADAEAARFRSLLGRLYAVRARAHEATGDSDAAASDRKCAEQLVAELAACIADPALAAAFEKQEATA